VLGLQSIAQASSTYGHSEAQTIVENRGEQHATEAAVLPAEVQQLPDLSGYLEFASHPPWIKVRFDLI